MASQTRSVDNTVSSQWNNPDNAFTENDQCTTATSDGDQNVYNIINTPFTIPDGATIDGIEVKTVRATDDNDYYEIELQDKVPTWKLKTGTSYFAVCANAALEILGTPTDDWEGSWDAAHINSSSFQIRLTYVKTAKANTPSVDHIEVVVYYTEGGQQYTRFAGGTIGTAGVTKKLAVLTRSKTGAVGVLGAIERVLVLTRKSISAIGVAGVTKRLTSIIKSASATISAVAQTARVLILTGKATASISTIAVTGKLVIFLRSLSASFSSVAIAIGEKLGAAEFTRFASASLSTVSNIVRSLNTVRTVQSIFSVIVSPRRFAHFIRVCTNKMKKS